MAQQSAVEFLLSELDIVKLIEREKLTMAAEVVRQAKAMEKELTLKFGIKCQMDFIKNDGMRTVEDIYNETYNK